jgi:hypothetical protein
MFAQFRPCPVVIQCSAKGSILGGASWAYRI